jgi:hypothetical protein
VEGLTEDEIKFMKAQKKEAEAKKKEESSEKKNANVKFNTYR